MLSSLCLGIRLLAASPFEQGWDRMVFQGYAALFTAVSLCFSGVCLKFVHSGRQSLPSPVNLTIISGKMFLARVLDCTRVAEKKKKPRNGCTNCPGPWLRLGAVPSFLPADTHFHRRPVACPTPAPRALVLLHSDIPAGGDGREALFRSVFVGLSLRLTPPSLPPSIRRLPLPQAPFTPLSPPRAPLPASEWLQQKPHRGSRNPVSWDILGAPRPEARDYPLCSCQRSSGAKLHRQRGQGWPPQDAGGRDGIQVGAKGTVPCGGFRRGRRFLLPLLPPSWGDVCSGALSVPLALSLTGERGP